MKIKQQTISVIGVFIILVMVFARGPIKNYEHHDNYEDYYTLQQTNFTQINDQIKQAKQHLDSLNFKKSELINEGYSYSGWSFDNLGVGNLHKTGMIFPDTTAYLSLGSVGVNINEEVGNSFLFYYEKNGQGYLSRTKLIGDFKETTEVFQNGKLISQSGNKVKFLDKKVNYRYSFKDKSMLIPLKSRFTEVVATASVYVFMFCQFALFIIIIGLFFKFLMFIARNNAFEEGNIQRLKYISICFFVLAVNKWIIYGIIYLIFISNYTSEGVKMNYSFWDGDYLIMILSIISFLIYTAFKRGMALQQEQDLTI